MIRINNDAIKQISLEYLDRLIEYANIHPKSTVAKIRKECSHEQFKGLILCAPENLKSYSCPPEVAPSTVVKAYRNYFLDAGNDGINNAMWLMNKLNIKVCPYCNRTYTFTVKSQRTGGRNVRPELDHFLPKSIGAYMHLAISFYNLIPSCPLCNQLKGVAECDYHPYYGHLVNGSEPMFVVTNTSEDVLFPDDPKIDVEGTNNNISTLAIKELYSQHTDYVKEILDRIQAYNSSLYEPIIKSFQGVGRTPEEIDRLIWGNYIDDSHQINRPLSKLTADILKQFNIIK